MALRFAELMFSPAAKAEQARRGSRSAYARMERPEAPARDQLGPDEAAFIAARDSFYMASVTHESWPYVQHRGGPPGFLKLLDPKTLGFADYRGNRQYVSVGNLVTNDRVALFLMDYPAKRRLKLLGHARSIDADTDGELAGRLRDAGYVAAIEHAIVIDIEGFDWNCPQHITPRFTHDEVTAATAPLRDRLNAAEAERDRLAAKLAAAGISD